MERILPRPSGSTRKPGWLYSSAGAGLLLYGLRKQSWLGGLAAAVGADLFSCGLTGYHLYEVLGVDGVTRPGGESRIRHRRGVRVDRSIIVAVSPEDAYQRMRDLEFLPRVMRHLKSVAKLDERRSHWVAHGPAGISVEWDAEILRDVPGQLLSWRSIENPDVDHAGSVRFRPVSQGSGTLIQVALQYLPPAGALGAVVARLFGEEPELQIEEDLLRLKNFLETREAPEPGSTLSGSEFASGSAAGAAD
jgi:uncharacterized membrane protein